MRFKIAGIKPPSPGHDDFPIWTHSKDGFFSIKSAYQFLYQDVMGEPPSFPFDLVWKWKGLTRYQAFLWKVAHGKLLTNEERARRGISDSDICPLCHQQPESIMDLSLE